MTQPLKLTLKLESPVAFGHPWINSDGLVEHLAALDSYGREYLDLIAESTIEAPRELDLENPLAETRGIRHGSASFFDDTDSHSYKIYKRYLESRSHLVDSRKSKIRLNSGTYKNDIIRLSYYPASECVFYFSAEDADYLETLFDRYFTALGKKRSVGFGAVRELDWSRLDEDRSLVYDGCAMRPIPVDRLDGYSEKRYISWRAPYWADENHDMCAPPGAEAKLK